MDRTWIEERFFASLRMTPEMGFFRSLSYLKFIASQRR
jgi:hypothetical protein